MRALLSLVLLVAIAAPARADEPAMSEVLPGVMQDAHKPAVYMSAVFGHVWNRLYNDNHERGPTESDGWLVGINFRGEIVNLITRYGGRFGGTFDFDMLLASGGVIEGPQAPRLSYVYLGFTPALLLGFVNTKNVDLSAEVGMPITTDFYGASIGGVVRLKSFYLGYRIRSGKAWRDTEVLDERIRIGFVDLGGRYVGKGFWGIEIIDGYSEDDMGRADLGTMFRGSYTSVSLVISAGR